MCGRPGVHGETGEDLGGSLLLLNGKPHSLAAHFGELFGSDRQWSVCFLDYSSQVALPTTSKPPLIRALLARLRSCPCAVVRKGTRIVAYSDQPTPARVEEWIERLKLGELTWQSLEL